MDKKKILKLAKLKSIECFETNMLKATYYTLKDGTQISFGYIEGCRTDDHKIFFSLFDNIKCGDFKSLLEKTGAIGYCPETEIAWCLESQILTKAQEKFIVNNNVELSRSEI